MSENAAQLKRKRESVGGQLKKAKKQRQSDAGAIPAAEEVATNDAPVAQSTPKKQPPPSTKDEGVNGVVAKTHTKQKKQKHQTSKWSMSSTQGGWFLPSDPIFSSDEKHLLLATLKTFQVYSTDTSLLARSLSVGGTGFVVTAYALSSAKPSQVYVADSAGLITLWDWTTGEKVGRWDIGATVRNMAVVTQPGGEDDLVYCHETGEKDIINVHALRTKEQASETELKRVLKSTAPIQAIQVLLQGKYIIVATGNTITFGKRLKISKTALQDFHYVWRELQFSESITTFDTYFRPPTDKGKKSQQDLRDVLDLAVGDDKGVILLFEDILAGFAAVEKSQKGNKDKADSADNLRPKRLHWHRDAVGAVKWSLDGNYLISGGDETVLNIWQLATGKPQHLPHLSAAIENVVVSPSGTSYAVTLANNSAIVLSTSELEAKTNIIGLQSRRVEMDQISKTQAGSPEISQPTPTSVNPRNDQLLLAVPSSQPRQKAGSLPSQSYLQSYDLATQRSGARQALTRNNATEPNMAPDGGRIMEPNVRFLQASHDGEWLATVDEWLPPAADTIHIDEGIAELNEQERILRREVYLKVWHWDEQKMQWALDARIDGPHTTSDINGGVSVICDLITDPTEHGFATIGDDHVVRIWRPKTRLRDGMIVRGAAERGLVTWSLDRSIQLPEPLALEGSVSAGQNSHTKRLAWSADGSVLIAAVSGVDESNTGLIHFIDPASATIQRSMTEIDFTVLAGVGIVGRHLVVVTDCITVWDMVSDKPVFFTSLHDGSGKRADLIRLATNERSGTFAVSTPQSLKKGVSKISIYSTEQQGPLYTHTTAGIVMSLVSRGENGFIALDSNSCLRTISPTVNSPRLPTPAQEEDKIVIDNGEEVEEVEEIEDEVPRQAIAVDMDYDRPVVTQQDLEKLFHNGAALPPPKDMFSAVLGLFGGLTKNAA